MIIGVPKEIKNNENRVAVTPAGIYALNQNGHQVLIEQTAGLGSGFTDEEYRNAGATILGNQKEVYQQADLIVKVKEPLEAEYELLKEGQMLFTYLHLAPNRPLTEALLKKQVTGIAYETVRTPNGALPLLVPMSEVAGKMSVQIGANLLQKYNGGCGILLGGVPGVPPAEVVIIGGGVVGTNAAKIAIGMGARVTVLDINAGRLSYLEDIFDGRLATMYYSEFNIMEMVRRADLLVGAVLLQGLKRQKLLANQWLRP